MATVQFRARIDRNLKKSDVVLKRLGLDAGSYISMALTQLVNRRGIPFAVAESDEAYFVSEYGLTAAQSAVAMSRETARARRTGKLRKITDVANLAP